MMMQAVLAKDNKNRVITRFYIFLFTDGLFWDIINCKFKEMRVQNP